MKNKKRSIYIIFILFVMAVLVNSCSPGKPPGPEAIVAVACEFAIKRLLRSPSTADFPFGLGAYVVNKGNNIYSLISHVDAQNGFGGIVRTRFTCVLKLAKKADGEWSVVKFMTVETH